MANTKSKSTPKRVTTRKVSTKAATKQAQPTEPAVNLGRAVQIYLKTSTHPTSLTEPKITKLGELTFIEGTQVTGKIGHRLEGKKTLIACDHIASIIEFASEDDIWSEPQSKLLRHALNEEDKTPVLTLHEQNQPTTPRHNGNFNNDRQRFDYNHNSRDRHRSHKRRDNRHHHSRTHGGNEPV
jgi:hypothetical protein